MFHEIRFSTEKNGVVALHDRIRQIIKESGIEDGLCVIYNVHTTGALIMTSFGDRRGHEDIQDEIRRLIPTRIDFKHQHDTPEDAAGHVKSAIVGSSITLFIENGELYIGSTQGIYFLEFDGPRNRRVVVKAIGGVSK